MSAPEPSGSVFASSSSIAISAGGNMYEVEFRGEDKAKHAHDVVLGFMG